MFTDDVENTIVVTYELGCVMPPAPTSTTANYSLHNSAASTKMADFLPHRQSPDF